MIIEKIEFDKNFYDDDEMCRECGSEFDGLDECIEFKDTYSGGSTFMCIGCFEEFKKEVNKIKIEKDVF